GASPASTVADRSRVRPIILFRVRLMIRDLLVSTSCQLAAVVVGWSIGRHAAFFSAGFIVFGLSALGLALLGPGTWMLFRDTKPETRAWPALCLLVYEAFLFVVDAPLRVEPSGIMYIALLAPICCGGALLGFRGSILASIGTLLFLLGLA